jgi:hypothetical protein
MNELKVIEHQNQRVLTTQQLAEFYETDTMRITQNYLRNIGRYELGVHNFKIEGEELKSFKTDYQIDIPSNTSSLMLWTEKGALLHAKSLNTDKAWEVYGELVDTYFRAKQLQPQSIEDLIIMQAQSVKELKQQVNLLQLTTQTIKDTVISTPDNWREDINRMFNKIVQAVGDKQYRELRSESYKLLEERAHVDLGRRLSNQQDRMKFEGSSKSAIAKVNKMDILEADPKLKEIYAAIVKEFTIKYVA